MRSSKHIVRRAAYVLFAMCVVLGASTFSGVRAAKAVSPIPVPDFGIPGAGRTNMFLPKCSDLRDPKRSRCYVRGLLAVVERSGDPAHELPRIDERVHSNGGFLESNCHILMHQVGRMWATRHGVTLENVFRYVPKSNDPGCSAGFGMGLVIHLGTQIVLKPRSVIPSCTRLPTRFREYTCIHGSGHALMRGYHGQLTGAVRACDTLGKRFAPDCAQGAFHDYWISLSGGDGTKQDAGADTDPRSVCGSHSYPRPCWYRFFWERMPDASVESSGDFLDLCGDLEGLQRAGCIGGASLLVAGRRGPVEHARLCASLSGSDTLDCLRGINVPAVAGSQWEQLGLIRTCAWLPGSTRARCYAWFGRTLAVVTNGRFERGGCKKLTKPEARASCVAGARHMGDALRTFS